LGWTAAVREVQIEMPDTHVGEALPVVDLIVQANDKAHLNLSKNLAVVLWCESGIAVISDRARARSGECEELAWDDPIHVAFIHPGEEFVIPDMKLRPVEPVILDSVVKAIEAVINVAIETTHNLARGITERQEGWLNSHKWSEGLLRRDAEHDYLIGAYEQRRIGTFSRIVRAAVNHAYPTGSSFRQLVVKKSAVPVDHAQMKWTKVAIEWLIDKLPVNTEVMHIAVLWNLHWPLAIHVQVKPIQLTW
jgi:hypothetical protein